MILFLIASIFWTPYFQSIESVLGSSQSLFPAEPSVSKYTYRGKCFFLKADSEISKNCFKIMSYVCSKKLDASMIYKRKTLEPSYNKPARKIF